MKTKKNYKSGYISFDPSDLYEAATNGNANCDAYKYLYDAMMTSSNIQKKNKKGKIIEIDDIYPVTADETEQMRRYLNMAENAVVDHNDDYFKARLGELRGIVNWSSKRHWTFQWILIVGVIATLFCISLISADKEKVIEDLAQKQAMVESWTKQDTTIAFEKMKSVSEKKFSPDFRSANRYKYRMLSNAKFDYEHNIRKEKKSRASADTATTDKNKRIFARQLKEAIAGKEKGLKEYEDINKMKYSDIKEIAEEQAAKWLDHQKDKAAGLERWYVFFMILIPIYIISQRPYGFTITRLRLESKILGGIQKLMFGLAGGMAGLATAMEFMPDYVVRWSDGSTSTDSDTGTNAGILAIKLMIYAAALAIFCFTSCFMMIYLTAQGLRRNYNWSKTIAKMKSGASAASEKINEEMAKRKENNSEEK